MRVHFKLAFAKLAFALLAGLAALGGIHGQAEAATANLTLSGLEKSAHVSQLVRPAYHHVVAGEDTDRCYVRHLECRYTSGFGHRYRRCMARADCHYRRRIGIGRYPRSCRYWLHRCRENWIYPEDIHGCLRYHGCLHHYY